MTGPDSDGKVCSNGCNLAHFRTHHGGCPRTPNASEVRPAQTAGLRQQHAADFYRRAGKFMRAEDITPAPAVRCHRCGSKRLTLSETVEEIHTFDGGVVVENGVLFGLGEGISEPGELLVERSRLGCQDCGHSWHPRRATGGSYEYAP